MDVKSPNSGPYACMAGLNWAISLALILLIFLNEIQNIDNIYMPTGHLLMLHLNRVRNIFVCLFSLLKLSKFIFLGFWNVQYKMLSITTNHVMAPQRLLPQLQLFEKGSQIRVLSTYFYITYHYLFFSTISNLSLWLLLALKNPINRILSYYTGIDIHVIIIL